jgi:CheY-like chemotaxis protein
MNPNACKLLIVDDEALLDLGLPDRDGLEIIPLLKKAGASGASRWRRDLL